MIPGTVPVHWSWPTKFGSMGTGGSYFSLEYPSSLETPVGDCSLENNDVVVCAGITGYLGIGADWIRTWGLAVAPSS